MADKIKVAEFELDNIDALIASTTELKSTLDDLRESNKQLKKDGKGASEAYVENEAAIKSLSKEYNAHIKVLADANQASADLANREKLLTVALKTEVKTIDQARASNKLLNQLRNATNATTKEGRDELEKLNAKLDENNAFIKENSDAYAQQKINIGNYKDSVKEAIEETGLLNGSLFDFVRKSQEAGGSGKYLTGVLGNVTKGVVGMTKATLAFLATPIGATLGLIGGAYLLIKNGLDRSEESTNKLKRATAPFIGLMKGVLKALEPVGEYLIDGIVKGLELAEKTFYVSMTGIESALRFVGFDEYADKLANFTRELAQSAAASTELAAAELEYTKAARESQKVQLEYQKQAEKLRQIRDDENLSIKERMVANEALGSVLKEQQAEELRLARTAVNVANLRIKLDGETTETLDEQAEALTRIADIEERIAGQESEQLTNRVQLQREAAQQRKERLDAAIDESKSLLDLYIAENEGKAKVLSDQLAFEESVRDKRLAILQEELANGNVTATEAAVQQLDIKKDFLDKQSDLVLEYADEELQAYISANRSRLEEGEFLTQSIIDQETQRLYAIGEKQKEFHQLRLKEGEINEREYNDMVFAVDEEYRARKRELELQLQEQRNVQRAIDLENQRAFDEERLQSDLALRMEYLARERQAAIDEAKKAGADIALVNQLYDQREKQAALEVGQAKLDVASNVFGGIVDLLGKESAAGKAAAVAQAVINVAQGVTKAIADGGILGIVTGAIVAAAGAVSIGKILSTKEPKLPTKVRPQAEKGMRIGDGRRLRGPRHSQGGIPIEAEGGEWVINRKASERFHPILSLINSYGNGNRGLNPTGFFATGGSVARSFPQTVIDPNDIADTVAKSIKMIPVVNVANDTLDAAHQYSKIVDNASF